MSNKINKFINYKDYNLSINSQKVKKNDIFFAIQGTKDSGNNYINEAIKKKSSVIVSDKKITNYKSVRVKNVRKFLAKICSLKYFNKPKNIIAVTGTNGKSSVAHYHYQILKLNNISSSSIQNWPLTRTQTYMESVRLDSMSTSKDRWDTFGKQKWPPVRNPSLKYARLLTTLISITTGVCV